MQLSANRQQQTRSVVLFAKALTASDCCTSISKGGRITIPRVAVENNLPSVADKKHHEVVALDANDIEWTFVIKSWPNGGENKRVYVMEKTAPYMRRNKMKIGDVIAITRRPDAQLGVEFNSEAALHAVSQGRGRATGCANLTAAETIAAQRCLRNSACSKALGHAGFCDSGKPAAMLRHNPLAGLAAVAEQASNGSAGYGQAHASPKGRTLAADRAPSSQSPQGILVGKILTNADVEQCRVVLPRMAMEANMPEVVDASLLHVDLLDESGITWPVMLSMSRSGIAKRMFILEKIGVYLQQHNLKPGDCIAIKRTYDDLLHIVINADAPADVCEGPTVSGKDIDAVPGLGLVSDSADSMDVSRRQSVRRRRFKSGCEVNFARMLCGSLNRNGLADPFKNNEDDTFPEEQLPPPLQEHEPPAASDYPPRKAHHANAAPVHSQHLMHHFPLAQLPHQALQLQHTGSFPVQFPSFFDMYPAHAQAASQAFAAHSAAPHTMHGPAASVNGNGDAGPSANHGMLPNHQMAGLPLHMPLSGMNGAGDLAQAGVSPAAPAALGSVDVGVGAEINQTSAPSSDAEAAAAAAAAPMGRDEVGRAQQAGPSLFMVPPYPSTAVGTTGIMHRPIHYPTPTSGVPSLFHTSLPPAGIPQPDAALPQGLGAMPGLPSSSFPTSFGFPPNSSAADMFPPNLYYGAAADAARLYAHHMAPFAKTANISPYGPAGLSTFLPTPFAATGLQTPKVEGVTVEPAASSQTDPAGPAAGAAVETGRKRKTPGSSQKKAGKGAAAEVHGPVIARRAANRPLPQVPHGSLGKGSGTPKNLARSHVLVAKVLTNSDTHGRIILPRVSVEANLTFLMGYRSYSLPVKDRGGRTWEFVIKSWANGTENRRVYVLEQTGEYLKVNRLGVGDAVGICTNKDGDLVVASNSEEVRQATVRPTYGAAAVQHMPPPPPGKAESFTNGAPGRCGRSPCCTKFAGHSGFCSGPRGLNECNGAARLRQDEPEDEPTDQLQRRSSAAAAQEEAEDLSAAEEVVAGDMAVGTLVITHLTPQDLRAKEILLPRNAVEANILPALTYPLLKFKVVDDTGREHKVLLRSFVHGQESMYLLDRLAELLHSVNAQAGDMLMLTRDETGPVKVHLESIKYNHRAADSMARRSAFRQGHEDADEFDDDKAEFGSVLVCTRTSGCAKSAGHQGFCSGHKGFRRRFFEDMPAHADDRSSGDWSDCGSGTDSGQEEDGDTAHQLGPHASHFSGSPRAKLGKRKGKSHGAGPSKRAAVRQEVRVTCGSSSGVYDITRGCIALRAAQHGQIVYLELSPSEFEEHVMGRIQQLFAQHAMILSQVGTVGLNRLSLREQFCNTASGHACKSRSARRVTLASQRHGDYVNAVSAEAPVLPFTKDAEHLEKWSKSSWRKRKAHQQPEYPEQERLVEAITEINRMPPLVFAGECRTLQARLAKCAAGESFMLTGGDCAESFSQFSADRIRDAFRVMLQMSVVMMFGGGVPVVKVGRMAGQFAKPRSSGSETIDGVSLPSYRGDIINGPEFTEKARVPDPSRLVKAYNQSAATLNLLRGFSTGGYAGLARVTQWNLDFMDNSDEGKAYLDVAQRVKEAIQFMNASGLSANHPIMTETEFFVSHECLLMDYEEALTRQDSTTGLWYDCSGHFLWCGERTRQLDAAHVEFMRGIGNPIGVKVSDKMDPNDLVTMIHSFNPENTPGRLAVIVRMGQEKLRAKLPALVQAVERAGQTVTWICDPMHGNTESCGTYKTRRYENIRAEVEAFFDVHEELGTVPGGIHLEMTGDNVTECIGGGASIEETDLSSRYHTHCDPRLNAEQALEMSFYVASRLRKLCSSGVCKVPQS